MLHAAGREPFEVDEASVPPQQGEVRWGSGPASAQNAAFQIDFSIEGDLKVNKMKLVQAWIEIHQEELMADWELASKGETIFKIDPLK